MILAAVSGSVPKLVMASAVADDKLRLPTSKQCPASVADASDGVRAVSGSVPKLVMASAVADDKLRLPTSKQCPASVADASDGVRGRG
ncbi:hypothetical protein PF004_g32517 [Phytophthora fragariae]|uniref:Uncharacterized protein n=1 Tax=Phytophthora fragariae TaxID=53985 RepID=A0A6G0M748_9STRA|nr:hypothetical protein PF004_g32517 [Phytophthora fragariae]